MRIECEWCEQRAIGELGAQWTEADFLTYCACKDHLTDAEVTATSTRIDGQGPKELHWKYFLDDEQDWLLLEGR